MNDILLIQSPSRLQQLQSVKASQPEMEPPLPLVYLAPYLLHEKFRVEIIDLRIDSIKLLKKYLKERKPLVAGISVMPGSMLRDAIYISKIIKTISSDTKVIWGGSFPSLHSDLCLQVPFVDFVCCGDGEITLAELAQAIASRSSHSAVSKIKGLAFRETDTGQAITTEPREPIALESRPVGAWELLERYMPRYLGTSGLFCINTARGCPYRCAFCYNTVLFQGFKRYRTKNIDAVMEEINYLCKRYKGQSVCFMDDDFLANNVRGRDLLENIHRKYSHLKFRIDVRPDELCDRTGVCQLTELGLESVFMGVEGVSENFLLKIQKDCKSDDNLVAATHCNEFGIAGTYSFTCGYPGETVQDLFDRVAFAKTISSIHLRSRSQIEIISPIHGTQLFEDLKKQGLLPEYTIANWSHFSDWKSSVNKPWISNGNLYEAFQLAFYLAFSTSSVNDGGLRFLTKLLSKWSLHRLLNKNPTLLPEFRFGNYFLKKAIWGLAA